MSTKEAFLEALTEFAHVCTSRAVLKNIALFFFGAFLCELRKKDGGIGQIAVSCVLCQMISKVLCKAVRELAAAILAPNQLGIVVYDNAVIAAHAARRFISPTQVGKGLFTMNFKTAFYVLYRLNTLFAVDNFLPELSHMFMPLTLNRLIFSSDHTDSNLCRGCSKKSL